MVCEVITTNTGQLELWIFSTKTEDLGREQGNMGHRKGETGHNTIDELVEYVLGTQSL